MMSVKNRRNSKVAGAQGGESKGETENLKNEDDERAHQGIDKTYILPDPTKLTCWGKIQNQQMTHWLITPTFGCSMLCLLFVAAILGGFGAICLSYNN